MEDFIWLGGDAMTVFIDDKGPEETCVYLPEERSRIHHRLVDGCTVEAYEAMLERGWRRFGKVFFRPACRLCSQCRSLRLDVDAFEPNRSMRRNRKRNDDLEVRLGTANMSLEHLDLYHRYHRDMSERKGWRDKTVSPTDYFQSFVDGHEEYGHELLYTVGERLVGVALVDILPSALSAVYCYYDPQERDRGLGVFSVLQQVELARRLGRRHVYLGYWIARNASMRYKSRYRPHELLVGRPDDDTPPQWIRPSQTSSVQTSLTQEPSVQKADRTAP